MIPMKNENYNSVDWVREIREKNYEKYKTLELLEFTKKLIEEIKDTEIWNKFKK